MESTVNHYPRIGFNTHFRLEVKIKKHDIFRVKKAFDGNEFGEEFSQHPCDGFYIMRCVCTIKKAYLIKQLLKNIQVYD